MRSPLRYQKKEDEDSNILFEPLLYFNYYFSYTSGCSFVQFSFFSVFVLLAFTTFIFLYINISNALLLGNYGPGVWDSTEQFSKQK